MPKKTIKGEPTNVESQAPIIQELERCVLWAYSTFGGDRRGEPAVTVSIQSRGKKAQLLGIFRPEELRTKEGEPIHEIAVMSERLFDDPYEVLGTVIHETVHLFNHDCEVQDSSKGGRHNEEFKAAAESFGLVVEKGTKGWAYTKLGDGLRKQLESEFKPNLEVFRLFREQTPIPEKKPREPKVRPWICDCDITVQVATGVEFNAECQACGTYFKLKEKK